MKDFGLECLGVLSGRGIRADGLGFRVSGLGFRDGVETCLVQGCILGLWRILYCRSLRDWTRRKQRVCQILCWGKI